MIFLKNLVESLKLFLFESLKLIDLKNIYWISIITSPKPNSTADRTKKKKVNDNRFKLSKINPDNKTSIYNVTHKSSAVNNKCKAEFTFITIVKNNKKKIISIKLISPKINI